METQWVSWDYSNSLIISLCIEYIGDIMAITQIDPMIYWGIFTMISFNTPTHDRISLPALGGTDVFFSYIINPI